MSGAHALALLRRITLVLMIPVLIGLVHAELDRAASRSFESPLFFGTPANITVITTEIYNSINHRRDAGLSVCHRAQHRASSC